MPSDRDPFLMDMNRAWTRLWKLHPEVLENVLQMLIMYRVLFAELGGQTVPWSFKEWANNCGYKRIEVWFALDQLADKRLLSVYRHKNNCHLVLSKSLREELFEVRPKLPPELFGVDSDTTYVTVRLNRKQIQELDKLIKHNFWGGVKTYEDAIRKLLDRLVVAIK